MKRDGGGGGGVSHIDEWEGGIAVWLTSCYRFDLRLEGPIYLKRQL